jgi:1,2-diacylglycerol 3-alpha-glucosyltransferase
VRALPFLVKNHPDLVVLVVGHVFDQAFLRLADELGVRNHIVCTGEVAKDDVPSYVAAADVEAHDFHYFGLGTSTLEVMAASVPVVSVVSEDNFPGLALRSGENITIVPEDDPEALADAILQLLEDPARAARVGAGQRRFVLDHFSIEAVARDYLALYQRVSAGGRKRKPRSRLGKIRHPFRRDHSGGVVLRLPDLLDAQDARDGSRH